MTKASATVSASLTPELAKEIDRVRKRDRRTRADVVREALRQYVSAAARRDLRERAAALPEAEPTADEIEAMTEGTREFRKGKYRTLEQVRDGLRRPRRQPRRAKP